MPNRRRSSSTCATASRRRGPRWTAAQAQASAAHAAIEGTDVAQNPAVMQARANFRAAWVAAQRNAIYAPVSGYVAQRSVQLGNSVQPGQQLMTVVPLHDLWIDANFKESQLQPHPPRPAGEGRVRHLRRRRGLPRQGGRHRRRHRQRVLAAAGAERHRQLDQGGAARAGAHRAGRQGTGQASAAHRPVHRRHRGHHRRQRQRAGAVADTTAGGGNRRLRPDGQPRPTPRRTRIIRANLSRTPRTEPDHGRHAERRHAAEAAAGRRRWSC